MVFRRAAAVLAALFVFSAGAVRADEFPVPKQAVVGAEKAFPLGELVKLSVSPVGADKPAALLSTSEVWRVYDYSAAGLAEKPFFEGADPLGNRFVMFGSGIKPKTMFVSVAVTHLYVVYADEAKTQVKRVATKTVVLTADVHVGEGPPEPPGPGPKPPEPGPKPPEPTLPDGKYGLAKFVYDAVKTNKAADAKVVAKKHADSYRGVVAAVAAGTIKDPRTLLTQAQKATAGLGGGDPGWAKVADKVQERLFELYSKERKLNTVRDFSEALEELAVGLEAVR